MSKFSISKTYNDKILREQSKFIHYDNDGNKIVYTNPIDGVGEKKNNTKPNNNNGNKSAVPTFRMKKTIYAISDR